MILQKVYTGKLITYSFPQTSQIFAEREGSTKVSESNWKWVSDFFPADFADFRGKERFSESQRDQREMGLVFFFRRLRGQDTIRECQLA